MNQKMSGNMQRYLAMVEWHMRGLRGSERRALLRQIQYDIELKKLRDGLDDDEIILQMGTPRKVAEAYGVQISRDDLNTVDDVEADTYVEEDILRRAAGQTARPVDSAEEASPYRSAQREQPVRRAAFDMPWQKNKQSSPLEGVLKFIGAIVLFTFVLRALPGLIGLMFALFSGALWFVFVLPLIFIGFRLFFAVIRLVFGCLGFFFRVV